VQQVAYKVVWPGLARVGPGLARAFYFLQVGDEGQLSMRSCMWLMGATGENNIALYIVVVAKHSNTRTN
jgi:hypothetical protein